MHPNCTTKLPKGRKPLSPNGLDREMKREHQRQHHKKRKPDASRRRTEMKKRQQDKLRRKRHKHLRHRRLQAPLGQTVRRRLKAIRTYRYWRERLTEQEAARWAARQFQVSDSTIRAWDRLYRQGGRSALVPKPCGPQVATTKVPLQIQFLIVALRRLLGWNEKRMAQELAQRQIIKVSHTTIGRIFARYHLPTRTYHTLARRDGIPKRRYEKQAPNWQWHMDFAETHLTDGRRVVIVVLIDDHSRFCLCCQVVSDMTSETAIQIGQAAWQAFGLPSEIVTDNARAFASGFEQSTTAFTAALQGKGIQHCLITPYYPEGNGKAEAFVKIVKHECLNQPFATMEELKQALAEFVTYYNHVRLHSSLGYQPPATRYLGVEPIHGHGLAGIPFLPADLVGAFPSAQPVEIGPVNALTIKRQFALVPVGC